MYTYAYECFALFDMLQIESFMQHNNHIYYMKIFTFVHKVSTTCVKIQCVYYGTA